MFVKLTRRPDGSLVLVNLALVETIGPDDSTGRGGAVLVFNNNEAALYVQEEADTIVPATGIAGWPTPPAYGQEKWDTVEDQG